MAELANGGYFHKERTTTRPNFISSEVGLIQKTCAVPASLGVAEGIYKIVPAGTVIPANDATAVGVLSGDVNVTNGDRIGSVITSGHLLAAGLPVAVTAEAKAALLARGIIFDDNIDTKATEPVGK